MATVEKLTETEGFAISTKGDLLVNDKIISMDHAAVISTPQGKIKFVFVYPDLNQANLAREGFKKNLPKNGFNGYTVQIPTQEDVITAETLDFVEYNGGKEYHFSLGLNRLLNGDKYREANN